MSEAGLGWSGAGGEDIPAIGQTVVPFADNGGRDRKMQFQVAPVTQPLVAIAQLVDKDSIVILGKTHGIVYSLRDKSTIVLPREGNGYYLDMEVPVSEEEGEQGSEEPSQASFRRPE